MVPPLGFALTVLIALVPFTAIGSLAAWVITTANSGNTFTTASSFPNYPTSVTNDGAWAYLREEEATSSAPTSAAADSSGNSRPGTYGGTTNGPSTWWQLNDGSGTTAADSSGAANPGTLVNSPTWAGGALTYNGTSSYVNGRRPAVHTNASLTVAAWVNIASTTASADQAAVSQNGTHTFGFMLGMDGASKKWAFKMTDSDVASPTTKIEYSSSLASTGVWTHLVGVYDASLQKIYLYVNGSVIGNAGKTVNWDATGALQSGRDLASDAWGQFFNGSVDDVRVYNRALSSTETANLAASTFTEAAMTAGVSGALQGQYQGLSGTTAVAFAGAATAYENTTMANPTTFTLECWFRVSGSLGGELIGFHSTTSGSGGTHDRSVYVDSAGRITFAATTTQSMRSTSAYNDAGWHHLVASLGATQMKLYVDGSQATTAIAAPTPANYTGYWHWGGGDLTGMPNRPAADYLTGSIDEVALYTTQLSDTQVAQHYQRNY